MCRTKVKLKFTYYYFRWRTIPWTWTTVMRRSIIVTCILLSNIFKDLRNMTEIADSVFSDLKYLTFHISAFLPIGEFWTGRSRLAAWRHRQLGNRVATFVILCHLMASLYVIIHIIVCYHNISLPSSFGRLLKNTQHHGTYAIQRILHNSMQLQWCRADETFLLRAL